MASENTIYFYPGRGGHSHDGENSSFIDTSKYSLFDFSWGIFGDPSRIADQTRNYVSFENFIIDTVNNAVLKPANIILQPGVVNGSAHIVSRSIEANSIVTGTLTANELSANIILVNNVIRSNNFDGTVLANGVITTAGTVGWAVSGQGQAVFDTTFIRGQIDAASVHTPGIDIDSAGNLTADNFALYANGKIENGNFSVSAAGVLSATGANISGTIEASSLSTPGLVIDSNGDLTSGGGATVLFADGSIATSSGNFSVDASGNLSANNALLYGSIYAADGSIGAWTIDSDGIYNDTAGRYVALYPAVGSVSENVFEVNYLGWTSEISSSIMKVSYGGSFSYLTGGSVHASAYLAVGSYIAIDSDNRHYAYSIRPIVTGAQPTYVDITGSGWKYNATNLTHDGFPMAFGWRNSGGRLTFVVNNDASVSGTITNTITSDRRVKDNIRNVSTSVLDNFYSINTYEFDWNEKAPQWLQDRSCGVGVIADELKILYPEAVIDDYAYEGWVHRYSEHPEGFSLEEMELFGSDFYEFVPGEGVWQKPRYASVDYTVLIPHLISAIHDLNNRVKELESKV